MRIEFTAVGGAVERAGLSQIIGRANTEYGEASIALQANSCTFGKFELGGSLRSHGLDWKLSWDDGGKTQYAADSHFCEILKRLLQLPRVPHIGELGTHYRDNFRAEFDHAGSSSTFYLNTKSNTSNIETTRAGCTQYYGYDGTVQKALRQVADIHPQTARTYHIHYIVDGDLAFSGETFDFFGRSGAQGGFHTSVASTVKRLPNEELLEWVVDMHKDKSALRKQIDIPALTQLLQFYCSDNRWEQP
jgi:hypothetical protein